MEQETSYNVWLREKVRVSLENPHPTIPHDEVMAEMDNIIDQIEAEKISSNVTHCLVSSCS
nr:antitoxin [Bartonella sp. 220B]